MTTPSGWIGTPRSINRPDIIAARPTVEPTDRSMPPVKITKVMPTAMIALIAVCPTRIIKFCWVKNAGESTEKIPSKTNKAIKALRRKRSTPRDNPEDLLRTGSAGEVRVVGIGVTGLHLILMGPRGSGALSAGARRRRGPKLLRLTGHGETRP